MSKLHRLTDMRRVSPFEAFQIERYFLEEKIGRAADKIAKATNDEERQKAKRLYDMLCEERNWL